MATVKIESTCGTAAILQSPLYALFYRLTQKHLRFRYGKKTNGRTGGVPPTSRLALAVRNQEFECTYITLGLKKLESLLRRFTA